VTAQSVSRRYLGSYKKRIKKLLIVFGVTTASQMSALAGAFMLGSAAFGQTPMPPPLVRNDRGEIDEPTNFEAGFLMTLAWDLCGDPHYGELARQALTQQFNTCPFSAKAKAELKTFLFVTMPEIFARYKRIGPGDACNGMSVGRSNPKLDQYERDRHSIPPSWRLRCDQPVAPP
jgi:hypothetical protein